MGIQNFPAILQPIIQQNMLEREFMQPLEALLGFRSIADREDIPSNIGETITKTRGGLLPTAMTPLNPGANTNFDNGMTPVQWGVEQYTLTMRSYGNAMDLNTVQNRLVLANQFVQNAAKLGENAARTLDQLARDALYGGYIGGNTRVRATLGAPAATVAVDDIRGFQTIWTAAGVPGAVSAGLPLGVMVGSNLYSCISATADGTNISTIASFGGISGTLTFSTNVTVLDGTALNAVVSSIGPVVIRPNARATTASLVAGDTLKMVDQLITAASIMRDNGVPDINGYYHWFGDHLTVKGLFKDPEFQFLYRGEYGSKEYKTGMVFAVGGVKFMPTNMAPQQSLGGLNIRRSIICGKGALVEGRFSGMDAVDTEDPLHMKVDMDGVTMITRPPMDRLGEIISQAWKWIGSYTAPTDITANTTTIPTANNSAYKRAIVLESL